MTKKNNRRKKRKESQRRKANLYRESGMWDGLLKGMSAMTMNRLQHPLVDKVSEERINALFEKHLEDKKEFYKQIGASK